MAGRGDVKAGGAWVELFLKNNLTGALNKTLTAARKSLQDFSNRAQQVGTAAAHAAAAIVTPLSAIALGTDEMKKKLADVHTVLQSGIAPALEPILTKVMEITAGMGEWAKQNPGAVEQVFQWGLAFGGAALALKGLADVAKVGSAALTTLQIVGATALSALGLALAGVGAAIYSFLNYTSEGQELMYKWGRAMEDAKDKANALAEKTRRMGQAALEAAEYERQLIEAQKEGAKTAEAMVKSIDAAYSKRKSLVDEFMTDSEKFLAKEKQITDALIQVNKNRVMGFIGDDQAKKEKADLEEAFRRNRAREAERRAKLLPKAAKPEKEKLEKIEKLQKIMDTTGSSTSTGGALALAFGGGGGGVAKEHLAVAKKQNDLTMQQLQRLDRLNDFAAKWPNAVRVGE